MSEIFWSSIFLLLFFCFSNQLESIDGARVFIGTRAGQASRKLISLKDDSRCRMKVRLLWLDQIGWQQGCLFFFHPFQFLWGLPRWNFGAAAMLQPRGRVPWKDLRGRTSRSLRLSTGRWLNVMDALVTVFFATLSKRFQHLLLRIKQQRTFAKAGFVFLIHSVPVMFRY